MVSILGANSVSGGYEVSNSLRFNDGDNAELTRTPGSEGNKQIHTISMWVKRCTIGSNQALFSAGPNDSTVYSIRFLSDSLYISQSSGFVKDTSRLFRDPSAWYHIVIAIDTTDGTQNDRIKVYINGVLETSFAENTFDGGQNLNTPVNDDVIHAVGYDTLNDAVPFDGYIAEFHLIDGTQKAASDFGEFDDNGVWIPKRYTGTYGTNGVYLEFKQTGTGTNASGMGADTSGQDNHFAVTNLAATDVTTDSPTNNYATLNPLIGETLASLSEGNLHQTPTGNGWSNTGGTILIQDSGKWYAETVLTYVNGQSGTFGITEPTTANQNAYNNANQYAIVWQDANVPRYVATVNNGTETNKVNDEDPAVGDIFQVAYDADNGKIWFGKNNTWRTGNPSTDTTPTYSSITGDKVFHATNYRVSSGSTYTAQIVNFGQDGSFAGNKTAQGNSDANGYGDFYYSPPSGYYALNTKNLAEFG